MGQFPRAVLPVIVLFLSVLGAHAKVRPKQLSMFQVNAIKFLSIIWGQRFCCIVGVSRSGPRDRSGADDNFSGHVFVDVL